MAKWANQVGTAASLTAEVTGRKPDACSHQHILSVALLTMLVKYDKKSQKIGKSQVFGMVIGKYSVFD